MGENGGLFESMELTEDTEVAERQNEVGRMSLARMPRHSRWRDSPSKVKVLWSPLALERADEKPGRFMWRRWKVRLREGCFSGT
ncbi:hypothetical protein BH20ACT10_BH20ACT10_00050 [soil metagenome]